MLVLNKFKHIILQHALGQCNYLSVTLLYACADRGARRRGSESKQVLVEMEKIVDNFKHCTQSEIFPTASKCREVTHK